MCFSAHLGIGCWGGGGGSPKGLVQHLLMEFFSLDSSKIGSSKLIFLTFRPHNMTIQGM